MTDHDSWTEDEVLDRPRRGRTLLAVAFVLMVLAGLYAAAALYFGDKVPADTRIGGVAIGGKTPSEAQQALEDELSDEDARPVTVTVDGNGRGGPNQEYALALAVALEGAPGIHALACDSDLDYEGLDELSRHAEEDPRLDPVVAVVGRCYAVEFDPKGHGVDTDELLADAVRTVRSWT